MAAFLALNLGSSATAAASPSGSTVPVIVTATDGQVATAQHLVLLAGGAVGPELRLINGFAARVPAAATAQLSHQPAIRSLTPDAAVHLLSDSYDGTGDVGSMYSTSSISGARALWKQGFTGMGVDVALIDTGVAPVEGLTTPGKVVNGPDLSFDGSQPNLRYLDSYGHGTHIAGIIAGRDSAAQAGAYATDTSDFLGVAPDARILSVKVADAYGRTDVSQVIAALDWVVQHRHDNGLNVRVINLAFGTDSQQSYQLDPLAFAAEAAWKSGIVVVAAAGNDGAASGGLADPAYDPYLIAVGAADTHGTLDLGDDTVAAFSSYGKGPRFPDLLAPGVHIQSLRVPGSFIDSRYGATGYISPRFFRGSGTSQAAAVTTGAVALLLQQRPSLTPDQVKGLLRGTAQHLVQSGGDPSQGRGELSVAAAAGARPVLAAHVAFGATGTGSLEGARGTYHVAVDGVALTGEQDIFGHPIATADLAAAEAAGTSWTGGSWTGGSWTGGSWTGGSWTGGSWTGGSWTGGSWTGGSWTGGSWTGGSWSNAGWASGSWT